MSSPGQQVGGGPSAPPSISLTLGTPAPSSRASTSSSHGPTPPSSCYEPQADADAEVGGSRSDHLDGDAFSAGLAPDRYIDDNDEEVNVIMHLI